MINTPSIFNLIPSNLTRLRCKWGIFFKYLQKINDAYNPKSPARIRAQMVLKLTDKLQMAEIEIDSRTDV